MPFHWRKRSISNLCIMKLLVESARGGAIITTHIGSASNHLAVHTEQLNDSM